MTAITSATYLGYDVDINTGEIDAPCCCYGEDHQGHPYCHQAPNELIEDEKEEGGCYRSFRDGAWRWFAPSYAY